MTRYACVHPQTIKLIGLRSVRSQSSSIWLRWRSMMRLATQQIESIVQALVRGGLRKRGLRRKATRRIRDAPGRGFRPRLGWTVEARCASKMGNTPLRQHRTTMLIDPIAKKTLAKLRKDGIRPLRAARRTVSILTLSSSASCLIDINAFVFMRALFREFVTFLTLRGRPFAGN